MELSTSTSILVLLVVFLAGIECADQNCTTRGGGFSCYTCMGRDMENCRSGQTCCKGACFKLEDLTHNVMVKGCVPTKEEDASMKVRELDVKLYWAQNAKVKGESFFCKGEYCNSAPALVSLISLIIPFILNR